MKKRNVLLLVAALAVGSANASITLPSYITDNMIVQQNSILTVEGYAAPGSKVTVRPGWTNKPLTAKADGNGSFTLKVKTPPAGGPYSIAFEDTDGTVRLENILSGEVWLCSGQSNMEFPVEGWGKAMDYDHEVATAQHPDIRLLKVKQNMAFSPKEDVEVDGEGWQICSPASVADFSAVAYFFARELSEELKVPVGVIDTSYGGTPAEAWTSAEALGAIPGFEQQLTALKEAGYDADTLYENYDKKIEAWMALAKSYKVDFDMAVMQSGDNWKEIAVPGYWEQSVLPDFDGTVCLQRTIEIPADKAGKVLELKFQAIDDEDETYFNGRLVGKCSWHNAPRNYSVPGDLVKAGTNVISVKVTDFGAEGGIVPGVAEAVVDGLSIPLSGTWQYSILKDFSQLPPKPVSPRWPNYPTVLYNAMISPLKNMPLKGVLWYQGCANVGRDRQYESLFKALINDWRKLWGEQTPFYFVQLAGYLQPLPVQPNSPWAALRNAQAKALELENTGMAVAIDLGNPVDIHPKNKKDVAHRLALIALNRDYGKDCIYQSPRCISVKPSGNSLELKFDAPIHSSTNAITGFIIAGADGVFTTATPVAVDDCTLLISAPSVSKPAFVRYNWADDPCGNLYGPTGLPVAPFANDK
ncbi:MAG: 9-O-acetylesterase [Bacteroidales bacterium]|nr:9-O-acetylesterase [Bacteroidales bacterium]